MDRFRAFLNESIDIGQEHEILGMYKDNYRWPIRQISERTGVSVAGIYRVLEKYGIRPHRRQRDDAHGLVVQYHQTGLPVQRISELTGYSKRQCYSILQNSRNAVLEENPVVQRLANVIIPLCREVGGLADQVVRAESPPAGTVHALINKAGELYGAVVNAETEGWPRDAKLWIPNRTLTALAAVQRVIKDMRDNQQKYAALAGRATRTAAGGGYHDTYTRAGTAGGNDLATAVRELEQVAQQLTVAIGKYSELTFAFSPASPPPIS